MRCNFNAIVIRWLRQSRHLMGRLLLSETYAARLAFSSPYICYIYAAWGKPYFITIELFAMRSFAAATLFPTRRRFLPFALTPMLVIAVTSPIPFSAVPAYVGCAAATSPSAPRHRYYFAHLRVLTHSRRGGFTVTAVQPLSTVLLTVTCHSAAVCDGAVGKWLPAVFLPDATMRSLRQMPSLQISAAHFATYATT